MPRLEILKPTDQPLGAARLLDRLLHALCAGPYRRFRIVSAWASFGALNKLGDAVTAFRRGGGRAEAIFGLAAFCVRNMPSGGGRRTRRYGWI